MRPFDGSRVLLVVTGGIAAYKSAILARRLIEAGAMIDVVQTESALRFVGSATFEGITGRPVHRNLWDRPLAHLELGRDADVAIVAPATAEIIARLAAGGAGDLASATLLAIDAPVVICPAMNTRMWRHPATRRNMETLVGFGYDVVGPDDGPLAEGENGPGRMAEPEEILARAGRALEPAGGLTGLSVVVTAGPTRAPLDPVRFIGNRSSGRMGYALAAAAWRRGARVRLITGPGSAPPPVGPELIRVDTAHEMLGALETGLTDAGILLMAAAVGDFEVPAPDVAKLKKRAGEGVDIALVPGPDLLLETMAMRRKAGIFTLGFALETERALENGMDKLHRKGMDMVAVNLASEADSGFEVETNRVTLIDREGGMEELPVLSKCELADRLLDRIERALNG